MSPVSDVVKVVQIKSLIVIIEVVSVLKMLERYHICSMNIGKMSVDN